MCIGIGTKLVVQHNLLLCMVTPFLLTILFSFKTVYICLFEVKAIVSSPPLVLVFFISFIFVLCLLLTICFMHLDVFIFFVCFDLVYFCKNDC